MGGKLNNIAENWLLVEGKKVIVHLQVVLVEDKRFIVHLQAVLVEDKKVIIYIQAILVEDKWIIFHLRSQKPKSRNLQSNFFHLKLLKHFMLKFSQKISFA